MKQTKTVPKMQNSYRSARSTILGLVILTTVNCVLLGFGFSTYFLSSIFLNYGMLAVFGITPVTVAIALVVLGVYLCAYFFSKRQRGWMLAALILFSLDTLVVVGMMFLLKRVGENPLQMVLDLLFHAIGIASLAIGVKYSRIGTMSQEELDAYAQEQQAADPSLQDADGEPLSDPATQYEMPATPPPVQTGEQDPPENE